MDGEVSGFLWDRSNWEESSEEAGRGERFTEG